jgi:hypothetical protein
MRYQLVCCEVLFREMCDAMARSPHQVDVQFLPKGLHDFGGARMCRELQSCVDQASAREPDAVLMGYALCGNGLHGLTARQTPLVVPRAHDCIALLMGSRHGYQAYFDSHPGTYFRSTGWLERGKSLDPAIRMRTGVTTSLDDLIAKYGEDNGRYLFEEMNRYRESYTRLTFIETGLEPDGRFEGEARQEAESRQWEFEKITGSLRLFHQLVNGDWPEDDFLVVPPGHRLVARYDEQIIHAEPL